MKLVKRWKGGARRVRPVAWVALIAVGIAAVPALGETADEKLTDLVQILREQGVINEDQYAEMSARASKKEEKDAWTDRFSLWADFRARYEGFMYEQDVFARSLAATDPSARLQDRHRARYRARINLRGEVNSRAALYFRLASGNDDARSTNQTLGGSNPDFDTDDVRFDLAYATLSPFPDAELPGIEGGMLALDVGKVKNPFLWKDLGQDMLLWDSDITPEGASLRLRGGAGPVMLLSNTGIYVIDENSSAKDPTMFASQLGTAVDVADRISAGARGTLYHFFSLDSDFFGRAASGGNIVDGLARRNGSIQVVEGSAFVDLEFSELLPVKVYGSYAHNLSARSSRSFPGVDREDDAYVAGVLVGDKVRFVRIGAAYYVVEANAFPSMFLDSDILDGVSNRQGWAFLAQRELLEGVTFAFTAYLSKRIEGGVPFTASGYASDRLRYRVDLNFAL